MFLGVLRWGDLLGRGKRKQKARRRLKSRERRKRKMKMGKPVYFSLSNYSKQLNGATNRYYWKANLHKVNFRKSEFANCRFKAGHVTGSSMREATFIGCDFIKVNLRGTSFKNANFINCFFFQCDFTDCNFFGATFTNTYFVSSSLKNAKSLCLKDNAIINHYPKLIIGDDLQKVVQQLYESSKLNKYGVLLTDKGTINKWVLAILMKEFSERKILRFLNKVSNNPSNKQKRFITVNSFREDLKKYAPDMI